jgi:hypothetical protein
MRNTLVIALLLTSSTDAAAGWTKASESQAGTGYIDAASIVRSGDNATMWELTDYKVVPDPDNPYKSVKRQFEFDCKDKRIRLLSSNSVCRQYGSGSTVTTASQTGQWVSVIPASVGQILWTTACNTRRNVV